MGYIVRRKKIYLCIAARPRKTETIRQFTVVNLCLSCLQESGAVSPKVLSAICPAAMLGLHLGIVQQTRLQSTDSIAATFYVSPEYGLQQPSKQDQPNHPFSPATVINLESAGFRHFKTRAFQDTRSCLQYQELWSALKTHPSLLEKWTASGDT